jgi:hypothetical protein
MSLALAAVVLLAVFAPGVIFRRAYLSGPFSRKFASLSMSDEVAYSAIPAIALQLIALALVQAQDSYGVDFRILGVFILGTQEVTVQAAAFANLQQNLWPIAAYNLILWAISWLAGLGARYFVISNEWDRRVPVLRFTNEWYYLLTGRQWGLKDGRDFDVVWVDALVEVGDGSLIYSGMLNSYFLARDGGLDSICLDYAQKWRDPIAKELKPILIPGRGLLIKYSEILNLNISFYRSGDIAAAGEEHTAKTKPNDTAESAAEPV